MAMRFLIEKEAAERNGCRRSGLPARFFAGLFSLLVLAQALPAAAADFAAWDGLVKKYVAPATLDGVALNAVAYDKLKADPVFAQVVKSLEKADPGKLGGREEKLSFWINVYNILAVKMVVDHQPVESIRDIGNLFKPVWKRPAGVVGGRQRTLNDIEHEILRKMGDPRIHAAIVCASVSCPDLRTEAFHPDRLNEQLDDQMTAFLANPEKGLRWDAKGNRLHLSAIFDWFEDDFASQGGVLDFVARYAPAPLREALQGRKVRVSYLDYNWKVNAQ